MSTARSLVVVLAISACGPRAIVETPSAPSPSPTAVPPTDASKAAPPDDDIATAEIRTQACVAAARHITNIYARARRVDDPDHTEVVELFAHDCEATAWPDAQLACVRTATTIVGLDACHIPAPITCRELASHRASLCIVPKPAPCTAGDSDGCSEGACDWRFSEELADCKEQSPTFTERACIVAAKTEKAALRCIPP